MVLVFFPSLPRRVVIHWNCVLRGQVYNFFLKVQLRFRLKKNKRCEGDALLAVRSHQDLHDVNVKAQDNKGLCDKRILGHCNLLLTEHLFFFIEYL